MDGLPDKQMISIANESGRIHYHYTHVYRLLHRWGFKQKVSTQKVNVNTASNEKKEEFKKSKVVLDNLPKGFTAISLDESFFFFLNSLVRKVWIFKNTRPVVRITGSHQQSCLFGAVSLDRRRQLFRQYKSFQRKHILQILKADTSQISKMLLILR